MVLKPEHRAPAFQFIQDPLDDETRTHPYEHARNRVDPGSRLQQASVIVASFLYHAAMRDERLPRLPLPKLAS